MKGKVGRKIRYLTEKEFVVMEALFRCGVTKQDALAEIKMTASVFNTRVKEAMEHADLPKKELTKAQKKNIDYIFKLLEAQGSHAKRLVDKLDLDEGLNVRWLLATLYPDRYSQRVSEARAMKDDVIEDFGDPSEAQTQASELLGEGDKPDIPGME